MSKKINYDNIIIVKTEQTCWEKDDTNKSDNEIIEIGISLLNLTSLRVHSKKQYLIKPVNTNISEYCLYKTGLSRESILSSNLTLDNVCQDIIKNYSSQKRPWATFGDGDRKIIEKQCKKEEVQFPFTSRHINIKTLFPIIFKLKGELSLGEAMLETDLEPTSLREAGVEECYNIALLLKEIIVGGVASSNLIFKNNRKK